MPDIEYMKKLAEQLEKGEINFLDENDEFVFACDQCGKCCRNREDILLSPLDLYNLVQATGKHVMEIVNRYGDCYVGSSSHLPIVRLKFREEFDGSNTCYFLGRRDGKFYCRVHEHKPGVCRTYPLGKVGKCGKDQGDESVKDVQYFLQDDAPKGVCTGLDRAKSEHITQKVVDWVGGKERKRISDRYSQIFGGFSTEFCKRLDPNVLEKTPMLHGIFYALVSSMMYSDYDFSVTPDQFLTQMADNMERILQLTDLTMKHPKRILELAKEALEKNGQKLPPNEAV